MYRSVQTLVICTLLAFVTAAGCDKKGQVVPEAKIQVEDNGGQAGDGQARMSPIELTADEASLDSPAAPVLPEIVVHTSQGDIRIRLFAEDAPQTVDNFLENYVDRGMFHDTLIHFVEKDYMMIAGGYTSAYEKIPVRAPVIYEGENGLSNRRGTIAVHRHPDFIHSGQSEFFFNLVDNEFLDHQEGSSDEAASDGKPGYCVFGEIVEGIEVIDKIGSVEVVDREGFPLTPATPVVVTAIERIR
jgi:cyclophilin family peptidyl-prolyl cis-trans isomerase